MHGFSRHFRFAIRQLRKAPGFSAVIVLTLGLGIGATTAIFSLVEGVLLRPLPFAEPDRLVILGDHLRNGPNTPVTAREVATYSSATTAFSSMGAYIMRDFEVSGGATAEQVRAARVTTPVFHTLGVSPEIGRVFTQHEEDGHEPVAVISHALWVNRFGRDPRILERSLNLDRRTYSIIGVMPREFEFPLQPGHLDQAQLWVPMSFTADELSPEQAGFWGYNMVARLKDGVSVPQAAQDADRVAQQIMREFPATMSTLKIRGDATSLRDYTVADTRPLLRALFFAVGVVLLIACANVAGLLLVRAIRRRTEYAVRLALGAGSSAIVGQSIFEGLILSITGGVLGLLLATVVIRVALHLLPESMPRIDAISIDRSVVLFALLLAFATGALCSLAPAFAALRTNLVEALKSGGANATGGSSHQWLRSSLVVAEIAVALTLLTVSGAFLRSFQKMQTVDPGFRADDVLVASFRLPESQYATDGAIESFERSLLDRLSHQPGMVAAGLTSALPSSGLNVALSTYTVEGEPESAWKLKFGGFAIVSGDYFRAMDIHLIEGRTFTEEDRSDKRLVLIVNQSMARHAWPGQDPLGKRMHLGNPRKGLPWGTVVGVVADTKLGARDEPTENQFYLPILQPALLAGSPTGSGPSLPGGGYVALRAAIPPEQMVETLRSTVAEIDPLLALDEVRPMTDVISNVEAPRRFNTVLILSFAAGALLLAMIGIYAVVAFTFSMRRQEIAIRMALGAQRSRIARLVLTSSTRLALLGCILGILGALGISRLIQSFLFQVSPTDPLVYMVSVVIMLVIGLVAAVIPAMRAASSDPKDALRSS
jgi:putative ABC transport system permease protein